MLELLAGGLLGGLASLFGGNPEKQTEIENIVKTVNLLPPSDQEQYLQTTINSVLSNLGTQLNNPINDKENFYHSVQKDEAGNLILQKTKSFADPAKISQQLGLNKQADRLIEIANKISPQTLKDININSFQQDIISAGLSGQDAIDMLNNLGRVVVNDENSLQQASTKLNHTLMDIANNKKSQANAINPNINSSFSSPLNEQELSDYKEGEKLYNIRVNLLDQANKISKGDYAHLISDDTKNMIVKQLNDSFDVSENAIKAQKNAGLDELKRQADMAKTDINLNADDLIKKLNGSLKLNQDQLLSQIENDRKDYIANEEKALSKTESTASNLLTNIRSQADTAKIALANKINESKLDLQNQSADIRAQAVKDLREATETALRISASKGLEQLAPGLAERLSRAQAETEKDITRNYTSSLAELEKQGLGGQQYIEQQLFGGIQAIEGEKQAQIGSIQEQYGAALENLNRALVSGNKDLIDQAQTQINNITNAQQSNIGAIGRQQITQAGTLEGNINVNLANLNALRAQAIQAALAQAEFGLPVQGQGISSNILNMQQDIINKANQNKVDYAQLALNGALTGLGQLQQLRLNASPQNTVQPNTYFQNSPLSNFFQGATSGIGLGLQLNRNNILQNQTNQLGNLYNPYKNYTG